MQSQRMMLFADIIGALSLDAHDGRIEPFHHLIHRYARIKGQIATTLRYRQLLTDSEMIKRKKGACTGSYSFRCIPQVHGASKDALDHVSFVIFNEINSVTDNPTVFLTMI